MNYPSWRTRLRYWPIYAVCKCTGCLPAELCRWLEPAPPPSEWRPGLSILIPDRASPDLLAACLHALFPALARIDEPWQVVVSTSAASPECYAGLAYSYPHVEWCFSGTPLGFSQAVRAGVVRCRHDHVYLLNNDMFLHPEALREVLALRAPDVFAVASQIFFADTTVRREETGLTACRDFGQGTDLFDVEPDDPEVVRDHLYAGGGSSLFRTALLLRYAAQATIYEPVYWEDVEWGLRAWREGWRVLFCPTSTATHLHRATVSKLFSPDEIRRLFERNRLWFDLRNGAGRRDDLDKILHRLSAEPRSRRETTDMKFVLALFRARMRSRPGALPDRWFLHKSKESKQ